MAHGSLRCQARWNSPRKILILCDDQITLKLTFIWRRGSAAKWLCLLGYRVLADVLRRVDVLGSERQTTPRPLSWAPASRDTYR